MLIKKKFRINVMRGLRFLGTKMPSSSRNHSWTNHKTNMKLQIVSDLHLEFLTKLPVIEKHGDTLGLLGDIGRPFSLIYKQFIQEQSLVFNKVFIIMGNHEYYNKKHTSDEILLQAQSVCDCFENVHLLDRSSFALTDKTTLIGCTLWSKIDDELSLSINDFKKIHSTKDASGRRRQLTASQYREWHQQDLHFLESQMLEEGNKDKDIIVLTHHGPVYAMNGRYEGSRLCSAFTSNLEHLFTAPVTAWGSGHTHSSCDLLVNGIRCVSNMPGYPGETGTGFRHNVCIEYS